MLEGISGSCRVQDRLLSALQQDAHVLLQSVTSSCWRLEVSQPAQCLLAGVSKRCVQHSPSAPRLPWRMLSRDIAAVISDSVSLFLQIFFSLLGFPALKSCFEPKESKCSFWLCGEEEQRGI